ncbi:MAG: hypothetical protein NZ955_01720 [Candidatus Bathyarchaeota archaeon]|nr:hypothetical protein [Candidatus Bathyarchaeota archaeon]MCX8162789.1 hypothetical protein [Candidatus Bathyarchaeota archaeon]
MRSGRKAIGKGAIIALVDLVLFVALMSWVVFSKIPIGAPAGRASATVTSAGVVGGNIIRLTVANNGEVRIRVREIRISDTGIEGTAAVGALLDPGASRQLDVSLARGSIAAGQSVRLTIRLITDKGEFTTTVTVTG